MAYREGRGLAKLLLGHLRLAGALVRGTSADRQIERRTPWSCRDLIRSVQRCEINILRPWSWWKAPMSTAFFLDSVTTAGGALRPSRGLASKETSPAL
ncbi:MAG: hypothetical protein JWM55_1800 [Acidimicrobiaceae bacterium]|nr:hypothetical protein [Acidimicrobiaceae bacterium]